MALALVAIIGGFVLLIISAERFVEGAAATAWHAGISTLMIGVVIVGFGTSAPEMIVSAIASLHGNPGLALGNALGSNIINTGFILGTTALIAPINVSSQIIRKEIPILLFISILSGFIFIDNRLTRMEGTLLFLGFISLVYWTLRTAQQTKGDILEQETELEINQYKLSKKRAWFWLVMGLALLLLSSRILVWGSVVLAKSFGVSDLIIGLSIVALGTSLPELAVTISAARKKEYDIALGNIIGSNMFNLLAVVGIAGMIKPMPTTPKEIIYRDWPVMCVFTVFLFLFAYGFIQKGRISRTEGALFLLGFIAYYAFLTHQVLHH